MKTCSRDDLLRILEHMYSTISAQEAYLNQLDSIIGDAEHGSNLRKALEKALENVRASTLDSPSELIKIFGTTMAISGCGSGPLLCGLAIRALGYSIGESGSITPASIAQGLRAALDTVKAKGGSMVGDKTMVDALEPAVQTFEKAACEGKSLTEAFSLATQAAYEGMLSTVALVGKRGRSSYLGERGVGHQDPGATSVYLLLASVTEILQERSDKK